MTCDNGISAADQIAFAKKMGMTVVVTDHHDVPFEDTEEGQKIQASSGRCNYHQNSLTVRIQIKISVAQWLQ